MDMYFGIMGREAMELEVWRVRIFEPPYNILFPIILILGYLIPVISWLFRSVRRNITLMFWTSILVNIGMWIERWVVVVPPLSHKQQFSFTWQTTYQTQPIEWVLVLGSFALVSLGVLLFSKIFPIIPLFDIKEGQVLKQEVQIGRVKVPGVIRE
jgi:molybdopterin-containing oxidoreductase family membrane subunit